MDKMLIIYRCCEIETGNLIKRASRPKWFDKVKCLENLVNNFLLSTFFPAIPVEISMIAVHDGPVGQLYSKLQTYVDDNVDLSIDKINVQSNGQSYQHCLKIASENINDYDHIYFVEDDYIHTDNALEVLLEGLVKYKVVTGYFHKDRLTRTDDITRGREYIGATRSSHWVTNESTTCTYGISGEYKRSIINCAVEYGLRDRTMWRHLLDYGIRLWVPTPGVSTHLEEKLMTPFIDWQKHV